MRIEESALFKSKLPGASPSSSLLELVAVVGSGLAASALATEGITEKASTLAPSPVIDDDNRGSLAGLDSRAADPRRLLGLLEMTGFADADNVGSLGRNQRDEQAAAEMMAASTWA